MKNSSCGHEKCVWLLLVGLGLAAGVKPVVGQFSEDANGTFDDDWPGCKRNLTYYIPPGVPSSIGNAVREAARIWNKPQTGWVLTEVRQPGNEDVRIAFAPKCRASQFSYLADHGTITNATLTMGGVGPGSKILPALHEWGHALRLSHNPECHHRTTTECERDRNSPCHRSNNMMSAHIYFSEEALAQDDIVAARHSAQRGLASTPQR